MGKIGIKNCVIFFLALLAFVLGVLHVREWRQSDMVNKKVYFLKLFITKVVNGQGEVSFEDRLSLESAVRSINDEGILNAWKSFLTAKQDDEVQKQLKKLLSVLINDL